MSTLVHSTGKVKSTRTLTTETSHLNISCEKKIAFQAGQFVMLQVGEGKQRPYSIASAPWEENMSFCVKGVGETSNAITRLQVGEEVKIKGPMGHFVLPKKASKYVFITQGTGIAPFRSMIRTLFEKSIRGTGVNTTVEVQVLFGARTHKDILYFEEFKELAQKNKNFSYKIVLSREEYNHKGHVQDHLVDLATIDQNTDVFICGMKILAEDIKKKLEEQHITPKQIHTELYG